VNVGTPSVTGDLKAIHSSGATVIAVGHTGAASTVAYSLDSGTNWSNGTVISDPGENLKDVTVLSTAVAIAVGDFGTASTVLRTTDSGVTWNVLSITDDPDENLTEIAANGGTTVIAIGDGGSFVRSTDSGATWSNPIQPGPAALLNGIAASGNTVIAVGNQAGNSNIIFSTDQGSTWLTGTSTVLRTIDSGLNWSVRTVTSDPGRDLLAFSTSGAQVSPSA
jgi:photosystem II stability/assembly factor-like uncharacterized protein